jgi:hypothetical protein
MSRRKNKKRKLTKEEISYWTEVTIRLLKLSPHWIEFFQKKNELNKAKTSAFTPEDIIDVLEDDLRKMQN